MYDSYNRMLDKARRLTKKRDFMKLATQGRPIYGSCVALRVRKIANDESQVGFITSTKVMKLAVDRNRAKRRMRALLREIWKDVPSHVHLLFVLKPEVAIIPYSQLRDEIIRMLSKIPTALQKPPKISSRGVKFIRKHANTPISPKTSGSAPDLDISAHAIT